MRNSPASKPRPRPRPGEKPLSHKRRIMRDFPDMSEERAEEISHTLHRRQRELRQRERRVIDNIRD